MDQTFRLVSRLPDAALSQVRELLGRRLAARDRPRAGIDRDAARRVSALHQAQLERTSPGARRLHDIGCPISSPTTEAETETGPRPRAFSAPDRGLRPL